MNTRSTQKYSERYPRGGSVAVLCEGDIVGYEVDLLEKWTSEDDGIFVDVWACGTKTAIFGFSDAIGPAKPIIVVEDRDFRTMNDAKKQCDEKAKNRRDREVNVVAWRAWRRHEIENYLIEPDILARALAEHFKTNEATVLDRLESVLRTSVVEQAANYALDQARTTFPDRFKIVGGIPGNARMRWISKSSRLEAPSERIVGEAISKLVETAVAGVNKYSSTNPSGIVSQEFILRLDEWKTIGIDSVVWRNDWAGKEILKWLCRWLAAEFGVPRKGGEQDTREKVPWENLNSAEAAVIDRRIAVELQPRLVASLLSSLFDASTSEIVEEWTEIKRDIKSAAEPGRLGS